MCSFPDEDYKSVIKRWIKIVSLTGSTSKASLFQDYAISTLSRFRETSVELEIVMTSWSELNSTQATPRFCLAVVDKSASDHCT